MAEMLRATPVPTCHGPRGIDQLSGLIGPEHNVSNGPAQGNGYVPKDIKPKRRRRTEAAGGAKAFRRDTLVICPVCERRVARRMRGQRYCSRRCRQRANYAEKVARGDFLTCTIALPTTPRKTDNKFNALRWAKTRSSVRILGPADVLAVEVFGRAWKPAISSDGVSIEIGRLRARALVS